MRPDNRRPSGPKSLPIDRACAVRSWARPTPAPDATRMQRRISGAAKPTDFHSMQNLHGDTRGPRCTFRLWPCLTASSPAAPAKLGTANQHEMTCKCSCFIRGDSDEPMLHPFDFIAAGCHLAGMDQPIKSIGCNIIYILLHCIMTNRTLNRPCMPIIKRATWRKLLRCRAGFFKVSNACNSCNNC